MGLYDGNEWRKYRVVPRAHPLSPFVFAFLLGLEAKGLLDFQERHGITSVVQWSLHPVIFGVDTCFETSYEHQITHLIGAQPALELYDVF